MDVEIAKIAGLVASGVAGVAIERGVRKLTHKALEGGAFIRREPLDPDAFRQVAVEADRILSFRGTTQDTPPEKPDPEDPIQDAWEDNAHTVTTRYETDKVIGFPNTKVEIRRVNQYVPATEEGQKPEIEEPDYRIHITSGRDFITILIPQGISDISTSDLEKPPMLLVGEAKTRVRARRLEMPDVRRTISILKSVG